MSLLPLHGHRADRYHPPVSHKLVNPPQTRMVPKCDIIWAPLDQLIEKVSDATDSSSVISGTEIRSRTLSGWMVTGPKDSGH
jgi:hypothetical protein